MQLSLDWHDTLDQVEKCQLEVRICTIQGSSIIGETVLVHMAERISVSGWMADAADPLPCAFYGNIPMLFSQRVCDCFTLIERQRCGPR
jgi:hypothetical protein